MRRECRPLRGPAPVTTAKVDNSDSSGYRRHPGEIFREAFRRGARDALTRAAGRLPECQSVLDELRGDYELVSDD